MPGNPSGSGAFSGWNRSPDGNGAGFDAATPVTGNITVYAQWGVASSSSGSSSSTSGIEWGVETSSETSSGSSSMIGGASGTSAATSGVAGQDGSISTISIGGTNIPLFGSNGHWGLLNLIFSGVGALLALVALITYFTGRQGENARKKRLVTRIVAIAIAVASIVMVFVTQNFSDTMALSDQWTGLMLALLVGEVVFVLLSRVRKQYSDDDDDGEELYGQASHSYTTD